MVTRIGTARRKTRKKLSHSSYRDKGKIPLSQYFQKLQPGDKVALVANPAISKGMYFPRFHGNVATVLNKKGFCYQVTLKSGNKDIKFNVHPIHLKKIL